MRSSVKNARSIAVLTGAGVFGGERHSHFSLQRRFLAAVSFRRSGYTRSLPPGSKVRLDLVRRAKARGIAKTTPNAGHPGAGRDGTPREGLLHAHHPERGWAARSGWVKERDQTARRHLDARRCLKCCREEVDRGELENLPPYCDCGGMLRPGVVWFGESLPYGALESATAAVQAADVFIVAGTSAQVYPAGRIDPAGHWQSRDSNRGQSRGNRSFKRM